MKKEHSLKNSNNIPKGYSHAVSIWDALGDVPLMTCLTEYIFQPLSTKKCTK